MTNNERQLTDVAMTQELWAEATEELFREGWETREQADYYSLAFADAVLVEQLSLEELKSMASEANQFEKEAMEHADGDIENLDDADYIEAVARRIAHQSLRSAFNTVKTRDFLWHHQWDYLYRTDISSRTYARPASISSVNTRNRTRWLL